MDMKEVDNLMDQIRNTQQELSLAQLEYDIADRDMLDSVAYKIKSLSCKYEALNRRLRNHVFPKIGECKKVNESKVDKILVFFWGGV